MGCSAEANPFRVSKLEQVPFFFSETNWPSVLARLKSLNSRAAIIGPHGCGKTTLLEELKCHLEKDGKRCTLIRLTESERKLPKDLAKILQSGDLLLLDGAEQLSFFSWHWLLSTLPRNHGLVITSHARGKLPTLYECKSSLHLFKEIVQKLSPTWGCLEAELAGIYSRHSPNIRNALFELYERAGSRTNEAPAS